MMQKTHDIVCGMMLETYDIVGQNQQHHIQWEHAT